MKKTKMLAVIMLGITFCFSLVNADNITTPNTWSGKTVSFATAYYFHGNVRCATCKKIEQYAREALEQHFAGPLKSGALIFQPVNVDEPENRHYIQDFQLVTRSLVLVKYENGKRTTWKNLAAVWQKVGDRDAFFKYVKAEVAPYL